MPTIVSAFPGTGKAHLYQANVRTLYCKSDTLDDPTSVINYIQYVKDCLKRKDIDYVFVPTHPELRASLAAERIPFVLVFPEVDLKEEYTLRYIDQGMSFDELAHMEENWNDLIGDCKEQQNCKRIVLQTGQYLTDALFQLV